MTNPTDEIMALADAYGTQTALDYSSHKSAIAYAALRAAVEQLIGQWSAQQFDYETDLALAKERAERAEAEVERRREQVNRYEAENERLRALLREARPDIAYAHDLHEDGNTLLARIDAAMKEKK